MRVSSKDSLILVLALALAFVIGSRFGSTESQDQGPKSLAAEPLGPKASLNLPQGRRVPGKKIGDTRPRRGVGTRKPGTAMLYESGSGSSGSAGDIIAVTGSYGVGTSVLYVVDAKTRQLAVYEARGGSRGGRKLYLVGARRISLDLRLEGYNDESEHSYRDLERRFQKEGLSVEGSRGPAPIPTSSGDGGREPGK